MGIYSDVFETWKGKTVAFIGDSITDGIGTTRTYHDMLAEKVGFTALNYGVNGAQLPSMVKFTENLYREHPETDAIFVFGGTNDYNNDVELGEPFTVKTEEVNHDGQLVDRAKRTLNLDGKCFCGRYNQLLSKIRERFPRAQVILMTPIHRGYAVFGPDNVQPCDLYANACGSFIDDYAAAVKRIGSLWSMPVIDLYGESTLLPVLDAHTCFFHDAKTDRLHPNADGHARIAQLILGWLHVYPCL